MPRVYQPEPADGDGDASELAHTYNRLTPTISTMAYSGSHHFGTEAQPHDRD
jgi:hypothetical protein